MYVCVRVCVYACTHIHAMTHFALRSQKPIQTQYTERSQSQPGSHRIGREEKKIKVKTERSRLVTRSRSLLLLCRQTMLFCEHIIVEPFEMRLSVPWGAAYYS